jgi:hypothetical protein
MWANDNNDGPCHRCGGHTEMRLVRGRWKEVTIKEPNRESARADNCKAQEGKDG